MIDLKTLRSLVKLMIESELTEVDLQDGQERVKLCRGTGNHVQLAPASAPAPSPAASGAATAGATSAAAGADDKLKAIASPMVGSFYATASPDAAPFVSVGDVVEPDTVVCIIEAMKVFNEIKAEQRGTIRRVMAENGQPVEFGQPLFLIEPA
jgi:acetyl-CoA carboxylase biotin carboxyl carrier protein